MSAVEELALAPTPTAHITDLHVHPSNTRDVGDLDGLVESIRELGVLEPLLVAARPQGGLWVLAGKRRLAAAGQAGVEELPIHVPSAKELLVIAAENLARKDLTPTEEAETYLQLSVEGFDLEAIATAAAKPVSRIEAGLRVAGSGKATREAIANAPTPLTLEQAGALAEFDGDEDAMEQLLDTIQFDPADLDHELARQRAEVKIRAEVEAKVLELVAAGGIEVLEQAPGWDKAPPCRLSNLRDEAGEPITPDEHAGCEGHAAFVGTRGAELDVVYACTDPRKHGHRFASGTSDGKVKAADMDPAEREAAKAERAAVIANNKAWAPATEVRRVWVARLLARKKVPAGTLRFAVEELVAQPSWAGRADVQVLEALTGRKWDGYQKPSSALQLAKAVPDAQLPLVVLAQVAAAAETSLEISTWRCQDPAVVRYLRFLESTGYTLAAVEQLITDRAKAGSK